MCLSYCKGANRVIKSVVHNFISQSILIIFKEILINYIDYLRFKCCTY